MKKKIKRALAITLAFTMMMAMSISSFAKEAEGKVINGVGTCIVKNTSEDCVEVELFAPLSSKEVSYGTVKLSGKNFEDVEYTPSKQFKGYTLSDEVIKKIKKDAIDRAKVKAACKGKHKFEEVSYSSPTCTSTGLSVYVCEKCGASEVKVEPCKGHNLDKKGACKTCGVVVR